MKLLKTVLAVSVMAFSAHLNIAVAQAKKRSTGLQNFGFTTCGYQEIQKE